jgi:transcriptional regulator with XRE-family HTH domain
MQIDRPKLKRLRERRVLGVRELARNAGIGHDTVLDIKRGARQPRPMTIRKLAEAPGVEPEELIDWEGGIDEASPETGKAPT